LECCKLGGPQRALFVARCCVSSRVFKVLIPFQDAHQGAHFHPMSTLEKPAIFAKVLMMSKVLI
jgi:hypothetical protein